MLEFVNKIHNYQSSD